LHVESKLFPQTSLSFIQSSEEMQFFSLSPNLFFEKYAKEEKNGSGKELYGLSSSKDVASDIIINLG